MPDSYRPRAVQSAWLRERNLMSARTRGRKGLTTPTTCRWQRHTASERLDAVPPGVMVLACPRGRFTVTQSAPSSLFQSPTRDPSTRQDQCLTFWLCSRTPRPRLRYDRVAPICLSLCGEVALEKTIPPCYACGRTKTCRGSDHVLSLAVPKNLETTLQRLLWPIRLGDVTDLRSSPHLLKLCDPRVCQSNPGGVV